MALNILNCDPKLQKMMASTKVIWSHRQPPSLQRILCPSKLPKSSKEVKDNMISKCGAKKCEVCDMITPTNKVIFENGEEFFINSPMNCNSRNVIYMIKCWICKACYIVDNDNENL